MDNVKVNQRTFAKIVGHTPSWICRYCKAGKIPKDEQGLIPVEEGKQAVKQLERELEIARAERFGHPIPPEGESEKPVEDMSHAEVIRAYDEAKMKEKVAQAELRELELKVKHSELITRAEVESDARALGALLQDFGRSMPTRYAGLCEGRPAREIEEVLEDMWSDFLKVLHKSKFAQDE